MYKYVGGVPMASDALHNTHVLPSGLYLDTKQLAGSGVPHTAMLCWDNPHT